MACVQQLSFCIDWTEGTSHAVWSSANPIACIQLLLARLQPACRHLNCILFTSHSTSRYHADVDLQGMVLSAINGVGLALVIPNAQSITADYYDELDRGKAFGALYMTSALGGAIGSLYATNQGR